VYVTDENGQPRKLRLNTSLKVGGIGQFGQVGGDSDEALQTLWEYFGVDISPVLANFKKTMKSQGPRDAFKKLYQHAAKQLDQKLKNADPEDEANILNDIAIGITHFATLGDPNVELVDFNKGGFKILRFNKLAEKLKDIDLAATYVDNKTWPEVVIHERDNPKNKLLTIRVKIENRPKGIYVRSIIEKEPLLEKLTEYRKASWDNAPAATGAEDLDAVTSTPRLSGPGARAAKTNREPRMDRATLGREYKG
jgi:hypothetical protein